MDTIGAHITKSYCKSGATIEQNIQEFMRKFNLPNLHSVQIFIATPQAYKFSLKEEDILSFLNFIQIHKINVWVHCRYLDNLFSSNVKASTLGFIRKELSLCFEIGASGFVVHLYKYSPECVIESLKNLFNKSDFKTVQDYKDSKKVKIMLETPAINPANALYNSARELINIYKLTKKNKLNCGICIDTCHIYATGLNVTDINTLKEFFCDIIKVIPSNDLLIHLNDSAAPLGSGRDRHASLGEGLIWKDNNESLKWLLSFINKYKIDAVLERNEGNGNLCKDFEIIRKLI